MQWKLGNFSLKLDTCTMPNPILGNKAGATTNSRTGINHDDANVT